MITRVFVSAEITNKDGVAAAQENISIQAGSYRSKLKKVEKQNLHFTLTYIGDVNETLLERIKTNFSEIRFTSFEFNYGNIGGFPNSNHARIVWLGVDQDGHKNISKLWQVVSEKLVNFVKKDNDPFIPHITLFRLRNGSINLDTLISNNTFTTGISDRIDHLTVKQSTLTPLGPRYTDIITMTSK
jgi:RNA 2',3'-cyclic 3'-phosphodiesterase